MRATRYTRLGSSMLCGAALGLSSVMPLAAAEVEDCGATSPPPPTVTLRAVANPHLSGSGLQWCTNDPAVLGTSVAIAADVSGLGTDATARPIRAAQLFLQYTADVCPAGTQLAFAGFTAEPGGPGADASPFQLQVTPGMHVPPLPGGAAGDVGYLVSVPFAEPQSACDETLATFAWTPAAEGRLVVWLRSPGTAPVTQLASDDGGAIAPPELVLVPGADTAPLVISVDFTAPVVTAPPGGFAGGPGSLPPAATTYAGFVAAGGAASDNCTPVSALAVSSSDLPQDEAVVRTYTITDECGNSTHVDQVFTIDATPPNVTAQAPMGVQFKPVSFVDVTFSEPVVAAACVPGDINLAGPSGAVLVTQVQAVAANTLRIRFDKQSADGLYTLTLPPCVQDLVGNFMAAPYVGSFQVALPDLVAETLIPDVTEVVAGQPLSVQWLVENAGLGDATGSWVDRVLLSDDASLGNDIQLVAVLRQGPVTAGGSYGASATPTIPVQLSGTYYLILQTNAAGSVAETDTTNNTLVPPTPLMVMEPDLPDLIVSSFVAPSGGQSEQTFDVAWTVRNNGELLAFGPWKDQVVLSTNTTLGDSDDLLLGTVAFASNLALAPGDSYTRARQFTFPAAEGTYYLFFVTDAADEVEELSGEANNVATSPAIPISVTPKPDLAAGNLVVPDVGNAGAPIVVEYSTQNVGTGTANTPWQDAVYLSTNAVLDSSDTRVRLDPIGQVPFAPGAAYGQSRSLVLPISFEATTLYVIVRTDDANAVTEPDESNNIVVSAPITVIPKPAPDLRALSVTAPDTGTFGADVLVQWSAENIGTAAATTSWSDRIFLSQDMQLDTQDWAIGVQAINVQPLAPLAAPYEAALTVTLPLDSRTADGTYYILLRVDGNQALAELNETNNQAVYGPITLARPPLPNLQVDGVSGPAAVTVGTATTVTWMVHNVGSEPTDVSFLQTVYASKDGSLSGATPVANVAGDALAGGASAPQAATFTTPDLQSATVQFIVCADTGTDILEAVEDDNCNVSAATPYNRPDFTVRPFDAPAAGVAESTVAVTFTVDNTGSAAGIPYWIDALYLSTDALPGNDVLVATEARTETVLPSGSYSVTLTALIPSELEGAFYFVAQTERENRLIEANETNNFTVASNSTTITQPNRPNLQVLSVSAPPVGLSGTPLSVSWQVGNTGAAPATGLWLDRAYASRDRTLSTDDIELGNAANPQPLGLGASYARTATFTCPSAPGNWYLIVVADAGNTVKEGFSGGEGDNTRAADSPFVVATFTATAQADVESAPAGTPVTITGSALIEGTSTPAAGVPVVVRITTRGFERRFDTTADADGVFSYLFTPAPTEGGLYQIAAGPAHAATIPASDSFHLWALTATPPQIGVTVVPGQLRVGYFTLKNPGDVAQSGLAVEVLQQPANIGVDLAWLDTGTPVTGTGLAGLAQRNVRYVLSATDGTPATQPVLIRVTSAEGAATQAELYLSVAPALPAIVAVPEDLSSGTLTAKMFRGQRAYTQFRVRNVGGAATDVLNVLLPPIGWFSLASPAQIGPLAPGAEAAVVVQLDPPVNTPLGNYTGTIVVQGGTQYLSVPYRFQAVSAGLADIVVRPTDEFTYYADGAPLVPDTTVRLVDHVTQALVAEGVSDPNGLIVFSGVPEAYYDLEARAPEHGTFRTTISAPAGETTEVEAFMARNLVSYSWTVVPTDIPDQYNITINATFAAQVPAPVVVIEPTSVNLSAMTLPAQIDFTITNYGLIAAKNVHLNIGSSDVYELVPLVTQIGDLPGGCTAADTSGPCRVTVPVLVLPKNPRGACDPVYVEECHELQCGPQTYTYCSQVPLYQNDCPPAPGGWEPPPGAQLNPPGFDPPLPPGGGGAGPSGSLPPSISLDLPCCPQLQKCAKSALDCALAGASDGVKCFSGGLKCAGEFNAPSVGGVAKCVVTGLKCAGVSAAKTLGGYLSPLGPLGTCACKLMRECVVKCVFQPPPGGAGACTPPCDAYEAVAAVVCLIRGGPGSESAYDRVVGFPVDPDDPINVYYAERYFRLLQHTAMVWYPFGTRPWLEVPDDELPVLGEWKEQFVGRTEDDTPDGERISAAERAELLAVLRPSNLTAEDIELFLDRWNRTADYWVAGILTVDQVPAGQSTDFMDWQIMSTLYDDAGQAVQASISEGFGGIVEAWQYALQVIETDLLQHGEGVCAHVKIQLDQQVTVTRAAFRATLELNNGGSAPLEDIAVEIIVQDAAGNTATNRFGIYPPELTGALSGVDGTGSLQSGADGAASWIIVPTDEAAPLAPTTYKVRGVLQYSLNGEVATIPLFPVQITVNPNPNLVFKYFLEKQVFSDDPFTPEVEPAIPFSLGLLLQNTGAGIAQNVKIVSSQPKIIDNDRGLLVDFDIIGTQVGTQEIAPTLAVNLGDLGPGQANVARWLMVSSLQGEFVAWDASFEHVNPLGDPRLSIIDTVDIFGLTHVVQADDPNTDGLPDFLTDDFPDLNDLPDRVHLSNGQVGAVTAYMDPGVVVDTAALKATVTLAPTADWSYIRLDDPFNAANKLKRVTRGDGKELLLPWNAWQTNRVNRFVPGSPVERWVHLFDRGGDGVYTLDFETDTLVPTATAWISVKTHGALGSIGLPLLTGAPQSEPRPGGLEQLYVSFSEPVAAATFVPAGILVDGYDLGGQPIDLSGLNVVALPKNDDTVGEITFVPALPDGGRYCVQLIGITDRAGNLLDGNTARLDITVLAGDANGDRRVDNVDAGAVASKVGLDPIDRNVPRDVRSDLNMDGQVDAADLDIVIAHRRDNARYAPNACLVEAGTLGGPPAGAMVSLRNLGAPAHTAVRGATVPIDVFLSDGTPVNSAIVRITLLEPGLTLAGYTWMAPFGAPPFDDSVPPAATLPVAPDADTLVGPGYPDGVVDIELSNFAFDTFATGRVATLLFKIPDDFTGSYYLTAAPDAFGNGFDPVTFAAGPVFELRVVPDAGCVADMNCDGQVTFKDIDPFVSALATPALYQVQFIGCPIAHGDVNHDGAITFADIDPFVTRLGKPCR